MFPLASLPPGGNALVRFGKVVVVVEVYIGEPMAGYRRGDV